MEGFRNGEMLIEQPFIGRSPENSDYYLRLDYDAAAGTVTGFYATQADSWEEAFVIENAPTPKQIGLGTGNLPGPDGSNYDLDAFFDFLQVSTQPVPVVVNDQAPSKPTPTPRPTNTPLPEGVYFRDDFDRYLQEGWEWVDEDEERREFVEMDGRTWLQLTGTPMRGNVMLRDIPDGDFSVSAHLTADPSENFQQANIGIYEDFDNYVVLNIGYCEPCVPGGHGFYMETFIDNNPGSNAYLIKRDPELNEVYLKLEVTEGGSVVGYYATPDAPQDWIRLAAFGEFFDFKQAGIGAYNLSADTSRDVIARYDYFEITQP
jgi:hypothetical protein